MIRLAALAAHFYSRRQETTEKIMDFKTARRQTLLTALLLAAGAPALACTNQTIFMPNGTMLVCQTCGSMTTCY